MIDSTWDEKYPPDYFGVALDLDLVKRIRRMTGQLSALWCWWRWREVWPLLEKEFKP